MQVLIRQSVIGMAAALCVSIPFAALYVAYHFVTKYW